MGKSQVIFQTQSKSLEKLFALPTPPLPKLVEKFSSIGLNWQGWENPIGTKPEAERGAPFLLVLSKWREAPLPPTSSDFSHAGFLNSPRRQMEWSHSISLHNLVWGGRRRTTQGKTVNSSPAWISILSAKVPKHLEPLTPFHNPLYWLVSFACNAGQNPWLGKLADECSSRDLHLALHFLEQGNITWGSWFSVKYEPVLMVCWRETNHKLWFTC